jgi:hypothetical protein
VINQPLSAASSNLLSKQKSKTPSREQESNPWQTSFRKFRLDSERTITKNNEK